MAAPDITLERPKILVTLTSSGLGIDISQNFQWQNGYVELVYQTCDKFSVGDNVLFEPEKGVKLFYGSTIYFMIDDTNAAYIEGAAP